MEAEKRKCESIIKYSARFVILFGASIVLELVWYIIVEPDGIKNLENVTIDVMALCIAVAADMLTRLYIGLAALYNKIPRKRIIYTFVVSIYMACFLFFHIIYYIHMVKMIDIINLIPMILIDSISCVALVQIIISSNKLRKITEKKGL